MAWGSQAASLRESGWAGVLCAATGSGLGWMRLGVGSFRKQEEDGYDGTSVD